MAKKVLHEEVLPLTRVAKKSIILQSHCSVTMHLSKDHFGPVNECCMRKFYHLPGWALDNKPVTQIGCASNKV